jgi:polar amino acid transport system permease protein
VVTRGIDEMSSREDAALPPIAPRRRPARWIVAAVVLVLFAMFVHMVLTNPNWQWSIVGGYLFDTQIMLGLLRTIYLTLAASVVGLVIGLCVAAMRLSSDPTLRLVAALYVWVIRAIPALVLLLFVFFLAALLPTVSIGVPFGPSFATVATNSLISRSTAAVLGLGAYLGAYSGEIFRGGVLSVPAGQFEAARALGMADLTMMRRVVMPQTIRVIIPALANELITMFKNTSLVTVIGYAELLTTAQLIYAKNFETIPLLVVACLWYLTLTSLAMIGQARLERRFGRGFITRQQRATLRETLRTLRGSS